ncbi:MULTISPECIES: GNAT family N-acetyltransferase [unclassified Streptomyces]|uniref:GNAT family N-acetyltransferase n=1 Tax=unclassified Streptomyces TaxID=2593676 RepID=UPI00225597CC|nr:MULTISPECIES: GNAT family N-acetyltransferase [unclassified Streptomyces]MCX4790493.1 GNAT family N-acetyltransferase [Streptomyces sp. NBC_01221]MCX4793780.1 GNAT family N-acetyltransferase [Streptomyces sp. NBC_01242]WSJ35197.1 GNAT family N-acetyltransferase [Streptomyces sp. NBC_01321]WSP61634.1 GNAT family N-acetyltransferase [Streptomyces sp. NBC_01240]
MTIRTTPPRMPDARVRVRDMTVDDCEAVAKVRVRGWQAAYAGLMPQSHLDAMDIAEDARRRRGFFAEGNTVVNVVAERPGLGVIGWACYGPYRENGRRTARGELYAIYVTPEQIGTGAGRALMTEMLTRAAADGFPDLVLWVLKENAPARRFYERAGFLPDGAEEPFDVDGVLVPELRYARALRPPAPAAG